MFSTLIKWFFLLVSGGILMVGLTPALQRWLDHHGFIPDQYSYGDLYNVTNLGAFKEVLFSTNRDLTEVDKPKTHYNNVHLYTIGDSFTYIDTSYYAGGRNKHVWVGGDHPLVVDLDTTKTNVLVIEFVERVLQERLYDPDYKRIYMKNGIARANRDIPISLHSDKSDEKESKLFARFGSEINQRLEFLLFNSPFFMRFKELKAQLMLSGFGRVPGAVISHNQQHLFYEAEADTSYVLSAFRHLTDRKIDELVANLNDIRQYYLLMGFDEVYICMIPNKVTILEPNHGPYNHQIERIEANPALEVPVISTIDTLRNHKEWYHLGDGHWNNQGKRFWLRRVNSLVAQWTSNPNTRQ